MREVHSELHNKESKKNAENKIDSILEESDMTREEFNELKGIAMEMKASGQIEVIAATPIAVATPSEGITVAQLSAQTPITPYVTIAQVQPTRMQHDQPRRQLEVEPSVVQRKF